MRNTMFKLAGVKTEKEFYEKYPTEESFMVKHGKMLKAQNGFGEILSSIGGTLGSFGNTNMQQSSGTTNGVPNGYATPTFGQGIDLGDGGPSSPATLGGDGVLGKLGGIGGIGNTIGKIGSGIQALKAEKKARLEAKQGSKVSDVALQAAKSIDVDERRHQSEIIQGQYDNIMRPINGEELFPVNGVGTNVLAKNGKMVKAQSGFSSFMSGQGGAGLSSIAGNIMKNDGGSQIGGAAGGAIGSLFGPAGQAIGEIGGKVIGGLLDRNAEKTKKSQDIMNNNINQMSGINFSKNMQGANAAYMQYGGEIPGEEVQPLWGGGVEPISYNPYTEGDGTGMFKGNSHKEGGIGIEFGGNKIEAEGGEPTIKMAQHGSEDPGLVIFGDLPITENTSKLIGDPEAKGKKFKKYVEAIANKETKANSKKDKAMKTASDLTPINKFDRLKLSTQEIIQKGSDTKLKQYAELKENAALAQNSINQTAEEMGVDPVKLAKGSISPLSKSKLAKHGANIFAQNGFTITPDKVEQYIKDGWNTDPTNSSRLMKGGKSISVDSYTVDGGKSDVSVENILNQPNTYKTFHNRMQGAPDSDRRTAAEILHSKGIMPGQYSRGKTEYVDISPIKGIQGQQKGLSSQNIINAKPIGYSSNDDNDEDTVVENNNNFGNALNLIAPYINKGSDAEGLSANQLYGEMFALSHNQQEPVYAQGYRPELDVPYDISYQDSLNRNTSGMRAAQRMSQGNTAAQAMIQAQGYAADQPVLAQQFRDNQAMKHQVYSGNRATLNDAKLKNIQTYDQQFVRQSQAKSNTKEAAQLALNSISDKYAKNKLEQRTLKTYENMYNYRFGQNYKAYNVNDPVDFQAMENSGEGINSLSSSGAPENTVPIFDSQGKVSGYKYIKSKKPDAATNDWNSDAQYSKFGSFSKALKKF